MKNTKLVAILLLQAILVMGILSHVNADFFPECCDNCSCYSGAEFCDDAHPSCPDGCSACRVVTTEPQKTYRCADKRSLADRECGCGGPCKKY